MLIFQSLVFFSLIWFSKIDGQTISPGEYPHHVIIRSGGQHICSGSIINKRHILTAYSCVMGHSARDLVIVAGTHSLDENGRPYRIGNILNPPNTQDDIALLRTLRDIQFTYNVEPIEITPSDYKRDGYPITMTAFKKPPSGKPFTSALQAYRYEIVDENRCKEQYRGSNDKFMCLIKSDGEQVCNADIGGAIVANNYIIGIKIPGERCVGNRPERHLRVKYYSRWIYVNSDLRTKNSECDSYSDYDRFYSSFDG